MTTSPEALREAVERAEQSLFLCGPDGPIGCQGQINNERSAKLLHADLRTLLSALQEAREALRPFEAVSAQDIGDDEQDCDAFKPMSSGNARAPLITVGSLRRAAEVYRALSPGGTDE